MSRSLSNHKYKTALKHKHVHNCITHSKASRITVVANVGKVQQLIKMITVSHTQYGHKPLGGSISLKFLLETRLQSESFDTLDDLLVFRVQK